MMTGAAVLHDEDARFLTTRGSAICVKQPRQSQAEHAEAADLQQLAARDLVVLEGRIHTAPPLRIVFSASVTKVYSIIRRDALEKPFPIAFATPASYPIGGTFAWGA